MPRSPLAPTLKTKGIFEAWLSAMIGYLMYPVASAEIIVAVVTVAHDVFRNADAVTDLGSILGFFVIVFVGIFALMAIPNAVTHITGQISLASIAPQALPHRLASLWRRQAIILPGMTRSALAS